MFALNKVNNLLTRSLANDATNDLFVIVNNKRFLFFIDEFKIPALRTVRRIYNRFPLAKLPTCFKHYKTGAHLINSASFVSGPVRNLELVNEAGVEAVTAAAGKILDDSGSGGTSFFVQRSQQRIDPQCTIREDLIAVVQNLPQEQQGKCLTDMLDSVRAGDYKLPPDS